MISKHKHNFLLNIIVQVFKVNCCFFYLQVTKITNDKNFFSLTLKVKSSQGNPKPNFFRPYFSAADIIEEL